MALKNEPDLELTALFGAAESALRAVQDYKQPKPDAILLDLNLPNMSGLEAIAWFKKYSPESKIIVLSQSDMEADVLQAIRLGASGYLLKSSTIKQIKEAIRGVAQGGFPLDADIAHYILTAMQAQSPKIKLDIPLSEREMEILSMLAEGMVKKEIGDHLGISLSTVITHVSHIYNILGAVNAPAAINKAYRSGILPNN
jgi:DNA-binding NarL/FixJ family response regulator